MAKEEQIINNNKLINQFKNDDANLSFKAIQYINDNEIDYKNYYLFDEQEKLYLCKICQIFKGTKIKFVMERHILEAHLGKKEACSICGKKIKRLKEHIKIHNKNKFNKENNSIIMVDNINQIGNKNNISFIIKEYPLQNKNFNFFLRKSDLKNDDKIIIDKIFFYKNKFVGEGSFGKVFLGGIVNSEEIKAVKILEIDNNRKYKNFMEEKNNLLILKNNGNFPRIYDWSSSGNLFFIVQSLMGPSLSNLLNLCNGNFDLFTIYNIAIDLITNIKIIHESNLVHGDIKEFNICYGNLDLQNKENKRTIGYIDFGNSDVYKLNNKIRNLEFYKKNICTREYSSLEALRGHTFSRKDDMESIIYTIIKLYTRNLPWNNISIILNNHKKEPQTNLNFINENIVLNNANLKKLKIIENKNVNNERLTKEEHIFLRKILSPQFICFGLPNEFLDIFNMIRNLKYKDRPDYEQILQILENGKKKHIKETNINERLMFLKNGKIIEAKFEWEILIYKYMFGTINNGKKQLEESINKILNNFCLDLKGYIDYLFN